MSLEARALYGSPNGDRWYLVRDPGSGQVFSETELTGRTDVELAVLFQLVSRALAAAKPGTPARRAVIASLQNISSAREPSLPLHGPGIWSTPERARSVPGCR